MENTSYIDNTSAYTVNSIGDAAKRIDNYSIESLANSSLYNVTLGKSSWLDDNITSHNESVPLPPYWDKPTRTGLTVSLSIIMALSIIGNLMVIFVIVRNKGMRTRTNIFLCNLAVTDLLCAVLDMPFSIVTVNKGEWMLGKTACQFNGFSMPLLFVSAIHTMMYISIHKMISIKQPFSLVLSHTRILMMIAAAWLWALLVAYLTIHGLNQVTYKANTAQCGPTYPSTIRTYIHTGFFILTCYLIPLLVMAVCYAVMFTEISAHSSRIEQHITTQKEVIFLQQRRITCTLFLVLLAFVVCWTPYIVYCVYTALMVDKNKIHPLANPISYWFGYLNCLCNPIIYAMRSPAFREGYKQILCRGPTNSSSDDCEGEKKPKALSRFKAFLKDSLIQGTVHGSGSITGSVCGSQPPSRKSSMTSLANFLLFPKSRTLSTNSLPGNFRFSVKSHLLAETDTTKVTMIAGVPVLTKGGKIVCYQNPHETPRQRMSRHGNVFYPSSTPKSAQTPVVTKTPAISERSPLLYSGSTVTKVSDQADTDYNDSVFINVDHIDSDGEGMDEGHPRLQQRHSCESGFNDVDDADDAVFIVVADVEPQQREKQHLLSPDNEAALKGLLKVPHPPVKKRVIKSVSDACESVEGEAGSSKTVVKSTSDTCIKDAPSGDSPESVTNNNSSSSDLKKSSSKSVRRTILQRIFSRSGRDKHKTISASSQGSRPEGLHHTRDIDDVSDSGLVSGIHESPKNGEKVSRHVSKDVDVKQASIDGGKNENLILNPDILARTSSEPGIQETKSKRKSIRASKRNKKKSMNKSLRRLRERDNGDTRKSRDVPEIQVNTQVVTPERIGQEIQRSKSARAKIEKYPSVEKLDSGYKAYLEAPIDTRHRKKRKEKARLHSENDVISHRSAGSSHRGSNDSHNSRDPYLIGATQKRIVPLLCKNNSLMYRSVSDPNLTFKRLEEQVVQRSLNRKWNKTQKGRSSHDKRVRGRQLVFDSPGEACADSSMSTWSPDSGDNLTNTSDTIDGSSNHSLSSAYTADRQDTATTTTTHVDEDQMGPPHCNSIDSQSYGSDVDSANYADNNSKTTQQSCGGDGVKNINGSYLNGGDVTKSFAAADQILAPNGVHSLGDNLEVQSQKYISTDIPAELGCRQTNGATMDADTRPLYSTTDADGRPLHSTTDVDVRPLHSTTDADVRPLFMSTTTDADPRPFYMRMDSLASSSLSRSVGALDQLSSGSSSNNLNRTFSASWLDSPSPYKRCSFTGFGEYGNGSNRETVL